MCLVVSFTPLVFWWGTWLAGPWDDPKGEVLVVLAGSAVEADIAGVSSYLRAMYALLIYREGGVRRIVFCGGSTDGIPLARLMRGVLVSHGVPPEVVVEEVYSLSTRQSALYAKPILDRMDGRKVLMTSDYHMFRAARAFRKAGIEFLPRPVPDARKRASHWYLRWGVFLDLVQETVKIGYYYAQGWI
jgi:uncharacterized SAM-binding protein YcdF (DUF218 family)